MSCFNPKFQKKGKDILMLTHRDIRHEDGKVIYGTTVVKYSDGTNEVFWDTDASPKNLKIDTSVSIFKLFG